MEEKEVVKIVISNGDYREIYEPLSRDPKEADDKIKRSILSKKGMSEEEIESIIDQIDVESEPGVDGNFDDGPYTPIVLVRNIRREPEDVTLDAPVLEEQNQKSEQEPRQVMLKQYYGDRQAEKQRRETFSRFKSNIIQKPMKIYDKDGKQKVMNIYTIRDYYGKSQDSNELLLDGYQTRLEKLSRAHQRDFSPYERQLNSLKVDALKEIMEKYKEMHKVNQKEADEFKDYAMNEIGMLENEEFRKKAIQALIDQDTEFIETNNYGYNTFQNTSKNLETLGKLGEKGVKAQISVDQKAIQKMGLHALNTLVTIRNYTTAPINRALGTFVAAPVYRKMFKVLKPKYKEPIDVDGYLIKPIEDMLDISQRNSKGMFKNKMSHRYHARKDYFIEQEKEKIKNKQEKGEVKRTSLGEILKLAVVPRAKAIINYKEGNIAVLNAGLYDLTLATEDRQAQMSQKRSKLMSTNRRMLECDKEIEKLKLLGKTLKDNSVKEQINKAIELKEHQKLVLEIRAFETERTEIDSIQTDAVSMSQHDKANKAVITEVVKGVKTAGRIAVGTYISKYLYKEIQHQAKTPDSYEYIPGKKETIQEQIIEQQTELMPGLDQKGIGNITLGNIYSKSSGQLYHHVTGGNTMEDKTEFFRGLAFKYNGKLYAGSDGKGFDATVLTGSQIDQEINENTTIVSIVQEILQDSTKKDISLEQVEQLILDGKIGDFNVWRSSRESGVPSGWLNASQIVPDLIKQGSHEVKKEVTKVIQKEITNPGTYKFIPGEEYVYSTTELNPVVVAAEAGLASLEAVEWNDLLRYTRSQESILRRHPKLLEAMKEENDKKRESNKENANKENNIENDKQTKAKKLRDIASYQRNNKSKSRHYTYSGETMHKATEQNKKTVWEQFYGTKKEDFKSGYDENAIHVNDKEDTIDFEERE